VRRILWLGVVSLVLSCRGSEIPRFPPAELNVRDFGARGDGRSNDTAAVNAAIEKCSANGGGTVTLPRGVYLAASIHARSNVRLRLDSDALITGAGDGYDQPELNPYDAFQDFGHSHFHDALLWGEHIENFAIVGGRIDGGRLVADNPKPGQGDKVIALKSSRRLLFQNVVHRTGAHFVYLLNDCDQVTIDHVTIQQSRDGVNLVSCRNVNVDGCKIVGCGDDAIALKSDYALGKKISSANLRISNCYLETAGNAMQIGSETVGDLRDIAFSDVEVGRAEKSAIGITSADGALIENVSYSRVKVKNAACPIYLRVNHRLRSGEASKQIGHIRNVTIEDFTATHFQAPRDVPVSPGILVGKPESLIEAVTLQNVTIVSAGGGKQPTTFSAPQPKGRPHKSFAFAPAAALFVSYASDLRFEGVRCSYDRAEARPTLVALDVDGLYLHKFEAAKTGSELLHLQRVGRLSIRESPPLRDQTIDRVEDSAF
jgi:polygalacturonase